MKNMDNPIVRSAKLLGVLAAALAVLIPPAYAQDSGLSSLTVNRKSSAAIPERCVDVDIDGSRSFSCLNQELKRQAEQANPAITVAPIDARSPDIRVGVVNVPAVQQQYGQNFGHSVIPYRPPVPVYASPMR